MTGAEARDWEQYLGPIANRLGLARPVPAWAVTDLLRAGRAHLRYLRLDAQADREVDPKEQRRLRSEARRYDSKARTAENVLAKLAQEHRAAEDPGLAALRLLTGR